MSSIYAPRTHLHCGMVLEAAAAGKQIICEKPLALSIEEGQKMITACKKGGCQLIRGPCCPLFFQSMPWLNRQLKAVKLVRLGSSA